MAGPARASGWGGLVSDLGADLAEAGAWLMRLSPHDLPGPGRAALVAAAVAGVARVAGRGGRPGAAAGALGLLAGWGVLGLSHAGFAEPAGRLAVVAVAVLGVLLLGEAAPRRVRPLLPFGLGAASGWWLAGAPLHGARLLHGAVAAALLGAAVDVAARRLGRGAAGRGGRARRDAAAPAPAAGPEGVVVLAAALALCGGLLAAGDGAGLGAESGAFAAALVAAAVAAALLPGPEGVSGLAAGVLAAGMAAALGQGHWLRLPLAEDRAVDLAALSPLLVVALGSRLARRWGAAGPGGAAVALAAATWGLARWWAR